MSRQEMRWGDPIVGKPGDPIIWPGDTLKNPCPHPRPVVVRDPRTGVGHVECPTCGYTNKPEAKENAQ